MKDKEHMLIWKGCSQSPLTDNGDVCRVKDETYWMKKSYLNGGNIHTDFRIGILFFWHCCMRACVNIVFYEVWRCFIFSCRYLIPSLDRSHAGFYRCIVRNRVGALLQRRTEVQVACEYLSNTLHCLLPLVCDCDHAVRLCPRVCVFYRNGICWWGGVPPLHLKALLQRHSWSTLTFSLVWWGCGDQSLPPLGF